MDNLFRPVFATLVLGAAGLLGPAAAFADPADIPSYDGPAMLANPANYYADLASPTTYPAFNIIPFYDGVEHKARLEPVVNRADWRLMVGLFDMKRTVVSRFPNSYPSVSANDKFEWAWDPPNPADPDVLWAYAEDLYEAASSAPAGFFRTPAPKTPGYAASSAHTASAAEALIPSRAGVVCSLQPVQIYSDNGNSIEPYAPLDDDPEGPRPNAQIGLFRLPADYCF